jgi:integrase
MLIADAIELAKGYQWAGTRKAPSNATWAADFANNIPHSRLENVTTADIRDYLEACRTTRGNSPATLWARASVVSVLYDAAAQYGGYRGPKPGIPYPNVPRRPKWWLNPELEKEALAWADANDQDLADYIRWTLLTGLRVEETLRVTGAHLTEGPSLMVPGTKTSTSEATIPLSTMAAAIALRRCNTTSPDLATSSSRCFAMSYKELWARWDRMRRALGWPAGRHLKALRRNYARDRAAKGAPLPVIQQMLRHGSPATTMEYLRLTGGAFSVEEQRQWV